MTCKQAFLLFLALALQQAVDAFPLNDPDQHSAQCGNKITCPSIMPLSSCKGMIFYCEDSFILGQARGWCQQCEETNGWFPFRSWTEKEASYYAGFGHLTSLNPFVDEPPFLDGPAPPRRGKSP